MVSSIYSVRQAEAEFVGDSVSVPEKKKYNDLVKQTADETNKIKK